MERLKGDLQRIAASGFAVPEGADAFPVALSVLEILGSTDPVLRDELGLTVLGEWMVERSVFSHDEIRQLLSRALSEEMLFAGIGESETDSVFRRSFSALVVALGLVCDNRDRFLSEPEWRIASDRIHRYCSEEQDLRSYVDGKGWAHAPAHSADAVGECVRSRYADPADCARLWDGLASLVKHAPGVFAAEEDERIALALLAMVETDKVSPEELSRWIEGMASSPEPARLNWKLVVRSLYFRLLRSDKTSSAAAQLLPLDSKLVAF